MNHNLGYRNRHAAMEPQNNLRASGSGASRRQAARGHPPWAGRWPPKALAALHARALTAILHLRSLNHLLLAVRPAGGVRFVATARRSVE